jgi:hypothetical protein
MPDPVSGLIAVGGNLLSSSMQADAASEAAGAQSGAAQAGIDEQRRQFDEVRRLLQPYVQAGQGAISGFQPFQQAGATAFQQQQALSGLLGPEAQRAAVAQLEQSPEMAAITRQGEEAILQRASATGGLRGGNVQAALSQFRPQALSGLIERQLGRLGGFAGAGLGATEQLYRGGQASAAGQASLAQTTGANVGNLLGQMGAAQAGGALGSAAPFAQLAQIPGQLAGLQMATGRNVFGGLFGGTPIQPGVISGLPSYAVMPGP